MGDNEQFKIHTKTGLPVHKNGYLYVYVSNETPNIDVYFDNLQVTHVRGQVLEETHYYPFGLHMAGISSKALQFGGAENRLKYNGKELDDDLELNWKQYSYYRIRIGFSDDNYTGVYVVEYNNAKYNVEFRSEGNYWLYKVE